MNVALEQRPEEDMGKIVSMALFQKIISERVQQMQRSLRWRALVDLIMDSVWGRMSVGKSGGQFGVGYVRVSSQRVLKTVEPFFELGRH